MNVFQGKQGLMWNDTVTQSLSAQRKLRYTALCCESQLVLLLLLLYPSLLQAP